MSQKTICYTQALNKEPVTFWLENKPDDRSYGWITIDHESKSEGWISILSASFIEELNAISSTKYLYKRLPKVWGRIISTGQLFLLTAPQFISTNIINPYGSLNQPCYLKNAHSLILFDDYFREDLPPNDIFYPDHQKLSLVSKIIWQLSEYHLSWLGAKLTADSSIYTTQSIPNEFKVDLSNALSGCSWKGNYFKLSMYCWPVHSAVHFLEYKPMTYYIEGKLIITLDRPFSIEEARIFTERVEWFFLIFVTRLIRLPSPKFIFSDKKKGDFYAPRKCTENKGKSQLWMPCFPFNDMKVMFPDLLENFISKVSKIETYEKGKYKTAIAAYVYSRKKLTITEKDFLSLAVGLERLLLFFDCYKDAVKYTNQAQHRNKLIDLFTSWLNSQPEGTISKENMKKLKRKATGWLTECKLSERLEGALNSLKLGFDPKDIKAFAKEFGDWRNALSHGKTAFDITTPDITHVDLLQIYIFTKQIYWVLIMNAFELPKDLIKKALKERMRNDLQIEYFSQTGTGNYQGLFEFRSKGMEKQPNELEEA